MLRRSLPVIYALMLATPVLAAHTAARAQDNGEGQAGMAAEAPSDGTPPTDGAEGTGDPALSDEQALQAEAHRPAVVRDGSDPYEDPHEGYYFVGLLYRQIAAPKFIQSLFVDGGVGVLNPGGGIQFEYRKDAFSIVGNVWWQDFSFEGAFRASGDPEANMEMLNSSWSTVFASASFLWSTAFNDMFAIEYGVDVGLGVVLGDGIRTEAYSNDGGETYHPCSGPGDPNNTSGTNYCAATASGGPTDLDGENGEHYNIIARKWSDGGGVPNVVPWLGLPHIGLRIKPVHQFQIRIDAGFFGGFWFGGSLAYGI